jgi:1,2-phenylacetyl-CoA epoxidase PaaB subunit
MPRKPQQPQQRTKWHVYLQARAAKREWVGEIEAVDEREAIEIAAKEFKQPAKKLMAVKRTGPGRGISRAEPSKG